MRDARFYTIDLGKIQGRGDFRCPKCGMKISPDDDKEEAYAILEAVMKDDCLNRIALQCKKCQSRIYLTGFQFLCDVK